MGTDALHVVDDALAGKVFRTVERHVFEKMRQTILAIFLKNGTDILHDVEMSPSLRFLIVAQDIGQSIGECSDGESGVNGQGDVLSPRGETGGENKKNGGEMLHKKGLS